MEWSRRAKNPTITRLRDLAAMRNLSSLGVCVRSIAGSYM